jgi:membrane protein
VPFLMVFVFGLLFSVSVMLETILSVVESRLRPFFPELATLLPLAERVVVPALALVTFTLIYRILPDARARWRDVLAAAALVTVLFLGGRFVLAFFLARSNTGSVFGAAGSLVVLLVWVYFSANLLLLGAEFIKLFSLRFGRPIRPIRLARFAGRGAEGQ